MLLRIGITGLNFARGNDSSHQHTDHSQKRKTAHPQTSASPELADGRLFSSGEGGSLTPLVAVSPIVGDCDLSLDGAEVWNSRRVSLVGSYRRSSAPAVGQSVGQSCNCNSIPPLKDRYLLATV
jgi:hypothetical protein